MKSLRLNFLLKSTILLVFFSFLSLSAFAQVDFEIIDGDATICLGDSTLLRIDASVDSVIWSPTTDLRMPNSLSTFVSPSVNTTYFATLFSNGMTQVVPIQVNIISQAILGNNVTVCSSGGMLNYDFTDLPFPGDYSLMSNTSFAITETVDNIFNVNINNTPPGIYNLTVANAACGQVNTIQVEVVDGTAAELDFQEEDRVICIGEEVTLNVGAVAGQTYEWFANGGSVSTTNTITDTPTGTTTYVVSTLGSSCTLASQDSVTVTVNNDPTISLPETIAGCENDILQLGNNIAQAGTTYSWEPVGNIEDNIVDPNAVNAEVLVIEDGTYILTANNGCEIMDTIEVTLIDNDIDLADTLFVCKGDDVTITWTTNPPNDNVVWTNLDGSPLMNVPSPFTVTPDDVISYVATVENSGCTFSDTITLQVDSLPMGLELTFIEFNNAPEPICMGDTVQITSTTFDESLFPNIEYQWLSNGNISNPQTSGFLTPDSLFNLIYLAQETRVYARIATNGACIDTTEVEVPVVPILDVRVTPDDPVCPNSTVLLTGEALDPTVMPPRVVDPDSVEWQWMASSGTIMPEEGFGENTPTLITESSDVEIMGMATFNGCPANFMHIVPVLSTPSLAFPFNTQTCAGQQVELNSGGPTTFVYQWESTSNDLGGQASSSNPIVSPIITTTYSVTVTNGNCDPVEDQITIEVFDAADALTEPIEVTGCQGDNVTLALPDNVNGGPSAEFTWTPQSGGTSLTGTSIDINITQNEVYIISVTNNCAVDEFFGQAIVTSIPIPTVNIVAEPEPSADGYGEGEMIGLTVESPIAGATYTWSSTLGGNFSVNPSTSTVYTVPDGEFDQINVEVDLMGCTNTDFINFSIVDAMVTLPNIFTPGGSDNRVFRLRTVGLVEVTNLQIYDRWGNKVYDNDNVEQEWDGNINGEAAPSEVYIYTVTYQIPGQDPVTESRDLTLIR